MASAFVSSSAEVVVVDTRTRPGTLTLPITNSIPFRVLNFKDQYGTFSNSTFTISTQRGESFDDNTTSKTFSNAFSYLSLYSVSSKWMVMNATQTVQQTISSLTVNQLNFGTGAGWVQFGPLQATVVSSIQTNTNDAYINNLYVGNQSTINDIMFYGLFGNYNNTVLAEVSTGAGTQELLVFKGSSSSDRVRVQTTGTFVVETGVSARLFNSNTTQTLSNATPAFIINTSSNVGIQTANPEATLDVAGTARAQTLSTQALNVSSINGQGYWAPELSTVIGLGTLGYISTPGGGGGLSQANLTSTIVGLGTLGYISTASAGGTFLIPSTFSTVAVLTSSLAASSITGLTVSTLALNASTATVAVGTMSSVTTNSLTVGASQGWILTSPLQTVAVSTNTLWADVANINTGNITAGNISTVTTTNLQIGTGSSWILTSPIQTAIMSTTYSFADQSYVNTLNVGTLSTVNSIQYAGLFNQYNNTALAEVSTGAGTQEFLVFKGSSASDRIRMQTTGAFVVETGVSARLWNSNTTQTLSNATPAFVINTSSNVGIQTASPGATLDVAGTGRFQTLSSLALFASSIVAPSVFAAQFFIF